MSSETGSLPRTDARLSKLLAYAIYGVSLGLSIATWFLAIHSPLRTDETGSFWQIGDGFQHIWSRQNLALALPVYYYILWLSTRLLGTSEIALRIPSIVAMLAAACLFYGIGRKLFGREIAAIGVIIFCLNPITVFEAIDVRAYAFAMLLTNATLLLLLRLRSSDSIRLAAVFGLACAGIVYLQLLWATILPALALCFTFFKIRSGKAMWQQCSAAFVAFSIAFVPVVPLLAFLLRSAKSHVFAGNAPLMDLLALLAPGGIVAVGVAGMIFATLALSRTDRRTIYPRWQLFFCGSIALTPTLILFGIDALTPIHVFVPRYCFVAVPGIALCWAMLLGSFRSRLVRLVSCTSFAAFWVFYYLTIPVSRDHGGSWKYALQAAEIHASSDNAPVLICSPFPESNYNAMQLEVANDSFFFAPLSYYRLTVPVVLLPMSLNAEAIGVGSAFLTKAESRHARFLAMAAPPSYGTIRWLARKAAGAYNVHTVGIYDINQVKLVEFAPLSTAKRPK